MIITKSTLPMHGFSCIHPLVSLSETQQKSLIVDHPNAFTIHLSHRFTHKPTWYSLNMEVFYHTTCRLAPAPDIRSYIINGNGNYHIPNVLQLFASMFHAPAFSFKAYRYHRMSELVKIHPQARLDDRNSLWKVFFFVCCKVFDFLQRVCNVITWAKNPYMWRWDSIQRTPVMVYEYYR